ncbi:MAG TPA: methylated-DNA--[protein]-cysteine S-methyltransferase [Solirubrobacterales bacterium]|jgi:methylated-DNA-[protein]-cysteine S-methyltransferase|nr:methylated-DNA--[protein]-cysteine S-methyltransferase [Solirubrobacterales bacterium]
MATAWSTYESPIGPLALVSADGRLRQVCFPDEPPGLSAELRDDEALAAPRQQLEQYFAGARTSFELPLEAAGPDFDRAVWEQLLAVPFGAVVSYGELARRLRLDGPEAARDVGAAVGRTPIPIVIPCHRVVAADGALTGYRGGLERKRALLALESPQLALA